MQTTVSPNIEVSLRMEVAEGHQQTTPIQPRRSGLCITTRRNQQRHPPTRSGDKFPEDGFVAGLVAG